MNEIYTRKQIIDDIYVDYDFDDKSKIIIENIKKSLLIMEEVDFMEICKKSNISLGRFIKNRYYLKTL